MKMPNGYGSIVNLGKKRRKPFAARITIGYEEKELKNGVMQYKQKYKYLGYFEKRKDALECLAKYNANPSAIPVNITFEELYEEWSAKKFESLSQSAAQNYKTIYGKCSAIYKKPFKDLRTDHFQRIVDDNKHLTMINSYSKLFNQLYKFARKYDIEKNYASFVEYPKPKERKKRVPFTLKEINALWSNLTIPNVDIVLILLYTGMRVNELLDMEIKNVHLDKRYMFVEKSKTRAGIRNVPIHKKIAPLIEARYNNKNKFLCLNERGKQLKYQNFYSYHFATNISPILEMDHNIHETRHTFISQCDRLELNAVTVQRIVGHENKTITQSYTDKSINDIINVIDKFSY